MQVSIRQLRLTLNVDVMRGEHSNAREIRRASAAAAAAAAARAYIRIFFLKYISRYSGVIH